MINLIRVVFLIGLGQLTRQHGLELLDSTRDSINSTVISTLNSTSHLDSSLDSLENSSESTVNTSIMTWAFYNALNVVETDPFHPKNSGIKPGRGSIWFGDRHFGPQMALLNDLRPMNLTWFHRQKVKFYLYTKKSVNNPTELTTDATELLKTDFDPSKPTKFLIHGFATNHKGDMIEGLKDAFLANYDYNVIGVDWGRLARAPFYYSASLSTAKVATKTAEMINVLLEAGADLKTIHVLGHSLGAHAAGMVGSKVTLERISGFDPAKPLYELSRASWRLTPDKAKLVDVIHTCAGVLSLSKLMGTVDFFPNGGTATQPGCGIDLVDGCSHGRSYEFYQESIGNAKAFPSVACDTLKGAEKGNCNGDIEEATYMGYQVFELNNDANGAYYTETNGQPPYSKAGSMTKSR